MYDVSMKKLIAVVPVIAVLALVGCTPPSGDRISPEIDEIAGSDNNPNFITVDDSVLDLLSTPDIEVPHWDTTVTLPVGWELTPGVADEIEGQNLPIPEVFPLFVANTEGFACTIVGSTTYLSGYYAGRGDLYLSKMYAYGRFDLSGIAPDEKLYELTYEDDLKIQFVGGEYTSLLPRPELDPETGEPVGEPVEVESRSFLAARALDTVTKSEVPFDSRWGSDPFEVVPVLIVEYTCADIEDVSEADWDAFMSSLRLVPPAE